MKERTRAEAVVLPRRTRRPRGIARNGVRIVVSLVIGLVLLEGALRFLLFSDLDVAWRLRKEGLYTSLVSPEFWKLRALFSDPEGDRVHPHFDPLLGWRKGALAADDYRHADEGKLGARRLVLLYGDSYAACVTTPQECWQGLLADSELGDRYSMLNYGVGGYGLDQIVLLLEESIDSYADRNPIVILGILVDDDLDRTYLPLRGHPKPHFTVDSDTLVLHRPERLSPRAYAERYPPGITSYLWRYALFGLELADPERCLDWIGEGDHLATKAEINARLLARAQRMLESRGLTYFFVLFHGRETMKTLAPVFWDEFLRRELERLHIPFVSSKRCVLEDLSLSHGSLDDYFVNEGRGLNHFTAATNAVVFEALRRGLEGDYDPYEGG